MPDLRSLFTRIAWKRLAPVDIAGLCSNQHEINGDRSLRKFFGTSARTETAVEWRYFRLSGEVDTELGELTFYDARESQQHRSAEWRLYYKGDFVTRAEPGDLLILAKADGGSLHALLFPSASGLDQAASVLFDLPSESGSLFGSKEVADRALGFVERRISEELGFEVEPEIDAAVEQRAKQILMAANAAGLNFPSTEAMALAARELDAGDPSEPDKTLVAWLDREEQLFYAVEREVLVPVISRGFADPDEFLTLAKSVTNRRKSRMGRSLEKHLAAIFRAHKLRFSEQTVTEGKNKPDFLFPGGSEYHDLTFAPGRLAVLAAKSTAKDRWRQVLTEAERVPSKHLITLEPAISADQTTEMRIHGVQLVIPLALHSTYSENQQSEILTLSEFIEYVRAL